MFEVFGFQIGRSSGSLTQVCAAAGEVGLLLHRNCEIGWHHFVQIGANKSLEKNSFLGRPLMLPCDLYFKFSCAYFWFFRLSLLAWYCCLSCSTTSGFPYLCRGEWGKQLFSSVSICTDKMRWDEIR